MKFTNFCAKNFQAPLDIKLKVLDTCIVPSLCYAAETWGDAGKDVETIYRYGIRVALGIRQSLNNEITYIECNKFPLKCKILLQQLKFYQTIKRYRNDYPDSTLTNLINQAEELNLTYLKHYENLEQQYVTNNCIHILQEQYKTTIYNI